MIYQTLLVIVVLITLFVYFNHYLGKRNEYEDFNNFTSRMEGFEGKKKTKKVKKEQPKMDTQNEKVKKEFYGNYLDCPSVFRRGRDYVVYIKPRSKWAREYGMSGEFVYGRSQYKVREIYLRNFPGCCLPRILRPGYVEPNVGRCPFIVQDGNPCRSDACNNQDWSVAPNRRNMSKQCRREVINYCTKNNKLDPGCICWTPEYENTKMCRKLRQEMYDADDYNCKINIFNIEEHPDMKNYIRKDKVPCLNSKAKLF